MQAPSILHLVSYRDELDAAQNRADALEKELAEAKKQLALVKRDPDQGLVAEGDTALDRAAEPDSATRKWLGAPTTLKFERKLEGELPEDAYAEIVDAIHMQLGHAGTFTTMKGSFAWNSTGNQKNTLAFTNVYISSRRGKTVIRVEQHLGNLAGALYGGVGGGVGGGAIMAPLAPVFFMPWLTAITVPVWLAGWYWGCRRLYKNSARKRARKLEKLTDEIEDVARLAIQDAAKAAAAE